jgi:hypothetical protein
VKNAAAHAEDLDLDFENEHALTLHSETWHDSRQVGLSGGCVWLAWHDKVHVVIVVQAASPTRFEWIAVIAP